jgi:uncharacterized protein (TIGR00251 family)
MPEPQPQTITLAVRVTPRARRNAVVRTADKSLKVYVTAPPEDGRANDAVVEVVAEWLGVKRRQVEIIRGTTNRNKVLRVTGASNA